MIEVIEEPITELGCQGEIPIAFQVTTALDVEPLAGGLAGLGLSERAVEVPWVKDHDRVDGGPAVWASRFDVGRWGLFGAYADGRRVGGAVLAFDTANLYRLRGRRDLAVVWDLRVAPHARRLGVGAALFRASEAWALKRNCVALEIETQQVNVPACHFYVRMGCSLAAIDRNAYDEQPEEVQLIWHRWLGSVASWTTPRWRIGRWFAQGSIDPEGLAALAVDLAPHTTNPERI